MQVVHPWCVRKHLPCLTLATTPLVGREPSHRPAIDHHAPPTKIPGAAVVVAVLVLVAVVVVVVATPASSLRRLSAPPLAIGRGLGRGHVTRIHRLTPFPCLATCQPPSPSPSLEKSENAGTGINERERWREETLCCAAQQRFRFGKRRRRKEGKERKKGREEKGREGKEDARKRNRRANLHSIKRRPRLGSLAVLRQLTCCVSGTRARTWWASIGRAQLARANETGFACTHATAPPRLVAGLSLFVSLHPLLSPGNLGKRQLEGGGGRRDNGSGVWEYVPRSMGVGRGEARARRGAIRGRGCSAFVFVSNFRFVCVCVCTCVYVCARLDSRDSLSGTMFRLSIVFEDSSGVFLCLSLSLCISIRLVSLFRDSTRFRGLCVPCLAVCNGASESKACFCQAVERGENGRILGCGERLYQFFSNPSG